MRPDAGRHPVSRVVCTMPCQDRHRERLAGIFGPAEIAFIDHGDHGAIAQAARGAEIGLFAHALDPTALGPPWLGWAHFDQAGLDTIATPGVIGSDIMVTSAAGRSAPVLAEHALFLMLCLCHRADRLRAAQHAGEWGFDGVDDRRGLNGRSVLIVGMGHTGRCAARYCLALGMEVSAFRRKADLPDIPGLNLRSAAGGDGMDELLREADFVILAASLNNSSHHIIDSRRIGLLRSGSYIVNVARGELVDERALMDALTDGHLGGYGSDVFGAEPLDALHPMRQLENVYLSPHSTPQMRDRTGRSIDIIADNYRRYLGGEPLLNRLTAEDLYTPGQIPEHGTGAANRTSAWEKVMAQGRRLAAKLGG